MNIQEKFVQCVWHTVHHWLTDRPVLHGPELCVCDWDVHCFCLVQCWRTRKMPTAWRPTPYKMWVQLEGSLSFYSSDLKSDKMKNQPLSAYSFDMDCLCICLIVCYLRLNCIKVQDLENIFLASPPAACIVKCILSDFRCTKTWPTDMSLLRRHSQRWDKMFTISERYIVASYNLISLLGVTEKHSASTKTG